MTILYDLEMSLEKLAIVNFQELDYRPTPMGLLTLRRRKEITLGIDIYEIKLDEDFPMSSLFTVAEVALANLGLAELSEPEVDVVVGGLGLGYTARTVLEHPEVRELLVVDTMREVIEWHQQGLLPLGEQLTSDPRCRFVHGDFFAMSASRSRGFDPENRGRRYHAILLDVDHSPRDVLHSSHSPFYESDGLRRLTSHLLPGGVFALWSNDPPDEQFRVALSEVFAYYETHVVTFSNPIQNKEEANTVYVARKE
jgi:spermidine synthase